MAPRLSVKHLEVLAAFRRQQNLTKIAEYLKLTPSAVTRRIDEAEARLGFSLFIKSSNRIRLTPAGEYILQSAERILADLERAESVASHLDGNVREVIRIGMSVYSNFAWFPRFATEIHQRHPEIRFELAADSSGSETSYLKSGAVDIILTPVPGEHPGVSELRLFQDELVVLVAPTHKLAKRRFIRAGDIEEEDFYTYSMAVTPGFEYLEFLKPAKIQPKRYIVLDTPEAAAAAVKGGMGLTILSRWAMRDEIQDRRLSAVSLTENGVHITWTAMFMQSNPTSSSIVSMAHQLKQYLNPQRPKRTKPA